MKRLVIYFHYDAQGQVDAPCRYAVQALLPLADLLFVTNGRLQAADRAWVQGTGARLLERKNTGFDVGAYREALLTLGRQAVAAYDELVLMNFTLAGPVRPLAPMFAAMQARPELDFWGLTRHYAMRSRRFGGQVPEHLQSHFLAVRARMLRSDAFWRYWQQIRLPRSYEEAVTCHETRFTACFASQGYRWDSYVATDDLALVFVNPIMACPRELIAHRGCPFFKRRSFFTPYADELRRTDGQAARILYDHLKACTEYPVDDLLRALLRAHPLGALAQNLHWQYLLEDCGAGAAGVDLAAAGLRLLRFAPVQADAVTAWYLEQSTKYAGAVLPQAAALFAQEPLLGVLCPAMPRWPAALQAQDRLWRSVRRDFAGQYTAPVGEDPPPAPLAGWALVREAAFPSGIPPVSGAGECWRLPLAAQQNGFYTAVFAPPVQAGADADQLTCALRASAAPTAVAKQLGRLVKHRLLRR